MQQQVAFLRKTSNAEYTEKVLKTETRLLNLFFHLGNRSPYKCTQCRYSRTSIIRTPVCHFNVKGVQINEFVWISKLSDKIHYLAS